MSQPPTNTAPGDIVVKSAFCSALYSYRNRDTNTCTVVAEFSESDGLAGLLISEVRRLMGDAAYKVDKESLAVEIIPCIVPGDTVVRGSVDKPVKLLVEMEPYKQKLVGSVHVRFHNVTLKRLKLFNFESYIIKYQAVLIQLASDPHSYTLAQT